MHGYYVTILTELHIDFKHHFAYATLMSKTEERSFCISNSKCNYISPCPHMKVMHLRSS